MIENHEDHIYEDTSKSYVNDAWGGETKDIYVPFLYMLGAIVYALLYIGRMIKSSSRG